MKLENFKQFMDFELLDTGNGKRLERWGNYMLIRPDPQIIWQQNLSQSQWDKADAEFIGTGERGRWQKHSAIPPFWPVYYRPDIKLLAKLTPFKHTGIFAEQASNWEWLEKVTQSSNNVGGQLKVLNLFAYTGGATMVLTRLGHYVTHVDASKPAIGWAKENQTTNKFPPDSIRWILDDALKFATREARRGEQYDGIIMDPPAFGHSPSGKTWKFNRDLPFLLEICQQLLSPNAKFLLVNGYATNSSSISLHNILEQTLANRNGVIEYGELGLKEKTGREISTGIFARWSN